MDSSDRWWWFRICNENYSLSLTFPILFSIEIHHFPSLHCVIFDSCGWSIRARLTNLSWDLWQSEQFAIVFKLWHRVRTWQAWTTEVMNPSLCPTLCQLLAGCSCAPHNCPSYSSQQYSLPYKSVSARLLLCTWPLLVLLLPLPRGKLRGQASANPWACSRACPPWTSQRLHHQVEPIQLLHPA